jgi:hypothetical protein
MADFDLDALVLDTVRRQTDNASAAAGSRFVEDLGLSENGRKTLFAFLVETFTARGVNLPSRGFFQTDFLACPTPAAVQAAIREALTGGRKKPAANAKTPAKPAVPPAAAPARAPAPVPGAGNKSNGAPATAGGAKTNAPPAPKANAKPNGGVKKQGPSGKRRKGR